MRVASSCAGDSAVPQVSDVLPCEGAPLRVMCVDDCEEDALLAVEALRADGVNVVWERVFTAADMADKLLNSEWDIVIADYSMPQFNGLDALEIVNRLRHGMPFILVSGELGEGIAVHALKSGAHDYVMKHDLGRLSSAVRRAVEDAAVRQAHQQAETNLRSSEALLKSIVDTAADGIVVVDKGGYIDFMNAAAERMFGYKAADLIGCCIDGLIGGLGKREGQDALLAGYLLDGSCNGDGKSLDQGQTSRTVRELKGRRRDGSTFPVELTLGAMCVDGYTMFAGIVRDLTERKRAEERIRQLAHYDELTGLPNRLLFTRLLEQALSEAGFAGKQVAVLFIDLDRFKLINDTLNHDLGDTLLQQMAIRIGQVLPRKSTTARFGGDEFVVMIRDCAMPVDASQTAQRLLNAIAVPVQLQGNDYHVTASIGISAFPGDGSSAQTLLKNADSAMARAKEQGKNNFQFYSARMNQSSFERLVLERLLRRALELEEFELYYQPKFDLATRQITGMEALLRWMQPGMGMISPVKFIPLAEETGLILPIGAWVLRSACRQMKAWVDRGLKPVRIAVNLSPRQFVQDDLHATVTGALHESGLDADWLELEITESLMMDNPERAAAVLQKLRSLGIRLAIDDFGTGYSSLSYLKRFPIDHVKIDRSFIKDIPGDADDAAITRAIIAMAHNLRLRVIAEGVETDEQLVWLRQYGCEEAQGYLFGRPMPAEEIEHQLLFAESDGTHTEHPHG